MRVVGDLDRVSDSLRKEMRYHRLHVANLTTLHAPCRRTHQNLVHGRAAQGAQGACQEKHHAALSKVHRI